MEELGQIHVWHYIPGTNIPIPLGGVNVFTVMNTLIVMAVLWVLFGLAIRRMAMVPHRGQALLEMILEGFQGMIDRTMEFAPEHRRKHYLPLIAGLFMYICLSNALLLIPLPHIEKPTEDLNNTLALGLTSVGYALFCAFRAKGIKGYFVEAMGPLFHSHGSAVAVVSGRLSGLFFLPMHFSEELSKLISISCRLFGNIMGGAIVITIVSTMSYYFVFPQILYAFFLVFEAALQAFVFSMLTLIYITRAEQAHSE